MYSCSAANWSTTFEEEYEEPHGLRICLIDCARLAPRSIRLWRSKPLMYVLRMQHSSDLIRDFNRLRISEFTQNFWVFSFYIADFWQTFWVIWENGSNWSNLRLKMSVSALGRLKNHNVPHLHPNSTMFMPLDRLQLKIYAFSGKFNVCSKRVLLSWIKICRDFTLQTQIFTQKYRSWLRFYSEFLRKKLAVEVSNLGLKRNKHNLYCYYLLCEWGPYIVPSILRSLRMIIGIMHLYRQHLWDYL